MTLGVNPRRGRSSTLSWKKEMWSSPIPNEWSSEILLPDVMASRKTVFSVMFHIVSCSTGVYGWSERTSRTRDKSHLGKDRLAGGRIFNTPLRKVTTKGSSAHLLFVAAEIAATCTLRELRPRPRSSPDWRKPRTPDVEGEIGLNSFEAANDKNLSHILEYIALVAGFLAPRRVVMTPGEHPRDSNLRLSTSRFEGSASEGLDELNCPASEVEGKDGS